MKATDRVLSCLLILGGVGHTFGSFGAYRSMPDTLLWSLCTSLFIFLLGAVNFLRAGRLGDRALSWLSLVFNFCWLAACIWFGRIIHNPFDLRVVIFDVITLGLCAMSVRTMTAARLRS